MKQSFKIYSPEEGYIVQLSPCILLVTKLIINFNKKLVLKIEIGNIIRNKQTSL